MNNHLLVLEWDHCHWQHMFMTNTTIPIVTFLEHSFWMNQPSKSFISLSRSSWFETNSNVKSTKNRNIRVVYYFKIL